MTLIIQKYGGSSLRTPKRIETIAKYIHSCRSNNEQLVIVVSAMGNQTNDLIEQAKSISASPPPRELDMLISVGERISMSMLSIALHKYDVPAISLTGSQSGILTTSDHGNADIIKIDPKRIKEQLAKNKVVIVAGFQGVCPKTKEITTLGRGGSDLTAIALSDELKADRCDIYTDVDGFLNADPCLDTNGEVLEKINWSFCTKAALHGAKVIHSRAAILAENKQIAFRIRSSFNFSHEGTLVGNEVVRTNYCLTQLKDKKEMNTIKKYLIYYDEDAALNRFKDQSYIKIKL